jgi:hypothetical protein
MTANEHTPSSTPNEAPHHVQTPLGVATVSFVAVAFGVQVTAAEVGRGATCPGDRIVLRSTIDNHADTYAVFERATKPGARWHRVSDDLTAAELVNWNEHRRKAGCLPTEAFEVWLDRVADSGASSPTASGLDGASR